MPLFRLHFHYRKKTMLTTAENLWPAISTTEQYIPEVMTSLAAIAFFSKNVL